MDWIPSAWTAHLEVEHFGNPVSDWLVAAAALVAALAAFALVKRLLVARLRRFVDHTSSAWDDVVVYVLERTSGLLFTVVAVDAVARALLELGETPTRVLDAAAATALLVQAGRWILGAVGRTVADWSAREGADGGRRTAAAAFVFLARLVVWSVVLLLVLGNLGVEVGALVAGLGVGGIAAALAVQSALADLFAGFTIYLDRPFDIGDFIIVGDVLGNVNRIGIRSTHIASLGGESIVYPNGKLVGEVIRNYKRMSQRRIVFHLGVLYSTPADDLEAAPGLIRDVIESRDDTRFDRAHFAGFADSSLTLEVVYFVLSRDYTEYMDAQHAINLGVVRAFQERGIGFAFPTRTLHLADSHTLPVRVDDGAEHAAAE